MGGKVKLTKVKKHVKCLLRSIAGNAHYDASAGGGANISQLMPRRRDVEKETSWGVV